MTSALYDRFGEPATAEQVVAALLEDPEALWAVRAAEIDVAGRWTHEPRCDWAPESWVRRWPEGRPRSRRFPAGSLAAVLERHADGWGPARSSGEPHGPRWEDVEDGKRWMDARLREAGVLLVGDGRQ